MNITLVSAFWNPKDLGRERHARQRKDYLYYFDILHRAVPFPIVVYAEPDACTEIQTLVGDNKFRKVVPYSFHDLPYVQNRTSFEHMKRPENGDPLKDTLGFAFATWGKFEVMEKAVTSNPFSTSRFGWIDFGLAHVASLHLDWNKHMANVPEKIKLLEMRSSSPREVQNPEWHRFIRGRIAAGFMTGSGEAFSELRKDFLEEVESAKCSSWYPLEEQVLSILIAKHPDRYEVYFGDYGQVVSNYNIPCGGVPTILLNLRHSRDMGMNAHACKIAHSLFSSGLKLTEEDYAELLSNAFICAYYTDKEWSKELGELARALHLYGGERMKNAMGKHPFQSNLRFIGIET
jgi:hypothetical protein